MPYFQIPKSLVWMLRKIGPYGNIVLKIVVTWKF